MPLVFSYQFFTVTTAFKVKKMLLHVKVATGLHVYIESLYVSIIESV